MYINGLKGYFGILITILGTVGVFDYMGVTQDEFSIFLDNAVQVVGFIITIVGYVHAKLKLKKAGGRNTDIVTKAIAEVI